MYERTPLGAQIKEQLIQPEGVREASDERSRFNWALKEQ